MKPQISVIVPVYKVERYLRRCVQSILNQTHSNLEVILVDDGSPDGSGALCDEFAKQDSRVQVIHKDNGGLSDARNAGLSIARGDYVTFVDSDDWIEPDAYEAMLALAEESGAQLVCAGRYDEDETTGQITVGLCPEKRELISDKEALRRILRWDNMDSSACDKLYARALFRDIRYPVGLSAGAGSGQRCHAAEAGVPLLPPGREHLHCRLFGKDLPYSRECPAGL